MSNIQPEGYNEEERYFKEQERELLRRKQQAAEAARAEAKHPHFMKCPKCGNDLEEVTIESVKVDRCPSCGGIYLDAGELEQLTGDRGKGFFASLRKMF